MRTLRLAALATLVLVGAVPRVTGQPARAARLPSPAEARAQFSVIVLAASELATLEVGAADIGGPMGAWDRRWRTRLRSLGRASLPSAPSGPRCDLHEIAQLLGGTAVDVWNARMFLITARTDSLVPMARDLAARRVLADEAARRRGAGLSCEGLTVREEVGEDLVPADGRSPLYRLLEIARHGRAPAAGRQEQ